MNDAALPRSFYLQPALTLAPRLLGKYFVRKTGRRTLIGKIVEVEAYLGDRDPASHAYRGKTSRNEVMFREGGHLYVYFTYGMHYCANVVAGPEGVAHAVLLRAIEPVQGIEFMRNRRGGGVSGRQLTGGPARLCQALGLGREDNGADLLGPRIYLTRGVRVPRPDIGSSRRIGITTAVGRRWRFFIRGNPFLSR